MPVSSEATDSAPTTAPVVVDGCPKAALPANTCEGMRLMLHAFDDRFDSLRCKNGRTSAITIPGFYTCSVSGPTFRPLRPGFGCANEDYVWADADAGIAKLEKLLDPCFGPEWSRGSHSWSLIASKAARFCDLQAHEVNDSIDQPLKRATIMFRCEDTPALPDGGPVDTGLPTPSPDAGTD